MSISIIRAGKGSYRFSRIGARKNPAPKKTRSLGDVLGELAQFANKNEKITNGLLAVPWFARVMDAEQESIMVLLLDGGGFPKEVKMMTIGLVDRSFIHPREIFREAIRGNAVSIIMAHNHPSGNLEPSDADIEGTKRVNQAAKIIGIPMHDHLIVGKSGFTSLREKCPECWYNT
jgi:DNA repair protein RadC